ncbi:LTA synthase family protein [Flavobacteriaceae bacterium]|nr:LTA synthase family protein [Flavobacteriaceae bacterium]
MIIFDELSSSSEIFNYTKDSLDIEFDMELTQLGFKSFPVFKSLSLGTKLSLPSIFNFNLHKSEKIITMEKNNNKSLLKQSRINNELKKIFKNNILLDSLTHKDVKYNSYGLVTFQNETKKLKYHIWDPITTNTSGTTLDRLLLPTLFGFLKNKIIGMDRRFQNYNKEVLNGLNLLEPENNNFYYFHFYAPHVPFKYFNEFQNNNKLSHLENHILYKRFFLSKVLTVLKDPKFDKSRIIISGDHGYRFDAIIDKNKTSLYLKGYNEINNADYFTVQDLGFLINESF